MVTAIRDDMFTPIVHAGRSYLLCRAARRGSLSLERCPTRLWVITTADDVTWMTRHNELFSSAVFKNRPQAGYPAIDESISASTNRARTYQPTSSSSRPTRSI